MVQLTFMAAVWPPVSYWNQELTLNSGVMLHECFCHKDLARLIMYSDDFYLFFGFVEVLTFDISSDAFSTSKVITVQYHCVYWLQSWHISSHAVTVLRLVSRYLPVVVFSVIEGCELPAYVCCTECSIWTLTVYRIQYKVVLMSSGYQIGTCFFGWNRMP